MEQVWVQGKDLGWTEGSEGNVTLSRVVLWGNTCTIKLFGSEEAVAKHFNTGTHFYFEFWVQLDEFIEIRKAL